MSSEVIFTKLIAETKDGAYSREPCRQIRPQSHILSFRTNTTGTNSVVNCSPNVLKIIILESKCVVKMRRMG